MQWPRYVLDRIDHAGLGARLRDVCSSGIYLSTHYSGMGGAELALRMLMDEMRACGCQAWMHSWHAGDLSAFCRSVLLRHPGAGHGPQHVFGNLTNALPQDIVAAMRAIQAKSRTTLDELLLQAASPEDEKAFKHQVGTQAMHDFHRLLLEDVVQGHLRTATAYCYKCKQHCHLTDINLIHAIRQGSGMVVEVSGSTCVDFSAMNKNKPALVGDSNLVFAAWAAGVLSLGPDLIIHECVRAFPTWLLELWFGHRYVVHSLVLTPRQLGYPTNRPRRISICLRRDCAPLRIPYSMGTGSFGQLMARKAGTLGERQAEGWHLTVPTFPVVLVPVFPTCVGSSPACLTHIQRPKVSSTGDVYTSETPPEAVAAAHTALCNKQGLPVHTDPAEALPFAKRRRLQGYLELAVSKFGEHPLGKHSAFANLVQETTFIRSLPTFWPTLLKQSDLWSFKMGRLVLPSECFLSSGFPVGCGMAIGDESDWNSFTDWLLQTRHNKACRIVRCSWPVCVRVLSKSLGAWLEQRNWFRDVVFVTCADSPPPQEPLRQRHARCHHWRRLRLRSWSILAEAPAPRTGAWDSSSHEPWLECWHPCFGAFRC